VSKIENATTFLMMDENGFSRHAHFGNHEVHFPLGQIRSLCVVSSDQSFLVTSQQGNRSFSFGRKSKKVCRNEKLLEAETRQNTTVMGFRKSSSYQFEILEAQLYVHWMSKDVTDVCPGRLYCKDMHAVWNHAHVCCN
jgi:hypothetical protein